MKNFIYLFLICISLSCTSEKKRLLQVMEESSKVTEINAINSFFFEKRIQDKLYARIDSFIVAKELYHLVKYKPEYFIFNDKKDTCIVIYSEDIPFLIDAWINKKPSFVINLYKMSCVLRDEKWDVFKEDSDKCISLMLLCSGYKKKYKKERFIKNSNAIARVLLSIIGNSECEFGDKSDIIYMINKKYWFDE